MMFGIVHHTKLARSHTMNRTFGMHKKRTFAQRLQKSRSEFGRMANLESYPDKLTRRPRILGEEMKILNMENGAVRTCRIVPVGDIENVACHIFLHRKPWTTTQAKPMTLTDGVKPKATMTADFLSRLKFHHITGFLAQISSQILIVVDFPEKTNTLRVTTASIDKILLQSNPSHLLLHHPTNRENSFAKLPIVDLSKKISLILHRIRTRSEPFLTIYIFRLSVVASGDEIVGKARFLMKSTKLDEPVAKHIWIGSHAGTNLDHCVVRHTLPILLVAIHHLQSTSILPNYMGGHLKVLLTCAIPLCLLFWPNLDVKTIRLTPQNIKFVKRDSTVYTTRKQQGNLLPGKFGTSEHSKSVSDL